MNEPTFDITFINRTDGSERVLQITHEQLRTMSNGEIIHLLPSPTAYYEQIRILTISPIGDRVEYEIIQSTQVWQCQRCGTVYKVMVDGASNSDIVPKHCTKILEDGEPCGGRTFRFGDSIT